MATALYLSLKSRYNEEINMKVEMFLKSYGTSKPTRYTFSEVKKIAKRFKDKLGQGGFGSVYKGELPNGVPVAVKMLESSTGDGEEFINEVATIGLIHHTNIVRLLGFCSEGMRQALIYEFMPNESLEKFIFSHVSNISQELLLPNKMLDIALGIARGMEYLHQGCNQRILHFDIKPQHLAGLQLQPEDFRLWPCKAVCKGPKHRYLDCSKRHNGLHRTRVILSELWWGISQVRCIQLRHACVGNGERTEELRPKCREPKRGIPPGVDLRESNCWAGIGA
jgi:hypothetical protein